MSRKDVKLLLFILAVGIFIGLYLGVYNTFTQKADATEAEAAGLKPRLEELQSYEAGIPMYQSAVAAAKTDMETIAANYPNDVRVEDKIMFTVEMENKLGVSIGSVSFSEPVELSRFTGITEGENNSYRLLPLSMYRTSCSFSASLTYQTLKDTVNYVYGLPYLTNIDTISVSYDSTTGQLYGSIMLDQFFITGLDNEYHETEIPDVGKGTDNIFGTVGG